MLEMDRRELLRRLLKKGLTGVEDQAIGTNTVLMLLWCPLLEIFCLLVILNLASQKQGFFKFLFR